MKFGLVLISITYLLISCNYQHEKRDCTCPWDATVGSTKDTVIIFRHQRDAPVPGSLRGTVKLNIKDKLEIEFDGELGDKNYTNTRTISTEEVEVVFKELAEYTRSKRDRFCALYKIRCKDYSLADSTLRHFTEKEMQKLSSELDSLFMLLLSAKNTSNESDVTKIEEGLPPNKTPLQMIPIDLRIDDEIGYFDLTLDRQPVAVINETGRGLGDILLQIEVPLKNTKQLLELNSAEGCFRLFRRFQEESQVLLISLHKLQPCNS